jgi:hypothetical protein
MLLKCDFPFGCGPSFPLPILNYSLFSSHHRAALGVKDESGALAVIGGFRKEPVALLKASEPTFLLSRHKK